MNRKSFLQAILPATAGLLVAGRLRAGNNHIPSTILAPAGLRQGDIVAITCPAGSVEAADVKQCQKVVEGWGFRVKCGTTVGKKWQRYAGTDAERLADFQALLDDESISAIIFGRGGYGTMRIIDKIDWEKFVAHPKWLIGFSDITTIHLHVHANLGIPTVHAVMSNAFAGKEKTPTVESLRRIMEGQPVAYVVKGHRRNREGNCSGILVGGNLSIIQACSGSASNISTKGKILFIEDVHEYKHAIDRMLVHLKRSGKLAGLAGLVVGGLSVKTETDDGSYSQSIEDMVMEKVSEYDYPVCFDFPAGHLRSNLALKLGVPYQLSISATDVILNEIAETANGS